MVVFILLFSKEVNVCSDETMRCVLGAQRLTPSPVGDAIRKGLVS